MLPEILRAARDLIVRNGFEATTIHDIARLAGVEAEAVVTLFKKKENILFILARQTRHNILRLSKAATVGSKEPVDTLKRLVKVFINYTENNTDEMIVLAKADPSLRLDLSRFPNKEYDFLRDEYLYLFESAIDWGIRENHFEGVVSRHAAKVVVSLLNGVCTQLCTDFTVSYLAEEILMFVEKRFAGPDPAAGGSAPPAEG
ncbi:MAG: TetR/AcrR family transcriptional regulator [Desulfovibrionaceae bacterium]|nr:TetR/AcrR family transcriptional regulator [Desulfovibrionaceae bacterium]MBF0512839.1 TetR/AcrR family transcriptional regulator [Desulfovibrionaceae bacterium]